MSKGEQKGRREREKECCLMCKCVGVECVGVWVWGEGKREEGCCLTHEANMQPELVT